MDKPNMEHEDKATKNVGGSVDADIYWAFKAATAARKESMQQALNHALLLYIDCVPDDNKASEVIANE